MARTALINRAKISFRSLVKLAAMTAWLLLAPFAWIPMALSRAATLLTLELPVLAILYLITVLLGVLSVVCVPFIRTARVRVPLVCVFLIGFGANYVASRVQGESLSTHMIATLIQARQEYGHAFGSYWKDIVSGLLIVMALAPPLLLRPSSRVSLSGWFAIVPLSATILTTFLIGMFTGRLEELPSPIGVPVQVLFAAKESVVYLGPREALVYKGALKSGIRKIVFVVDESVRGDYLQMNDARFDNTPYLTSAAPLLANFGVAASFSNCSATARMALRSGARESDFPDPEQHLLRQPTLWQFAKAAHYRTIYLDTWLPVRTMSSMLTYDELKYVDERLAVSLDPYADADDRLADLIVQKLERDEPALLFVEKIGLHTPYRRNLPTNPGYAPSPAALTHQDLDPERAGVVKDYSVGIWWRVDRFFQRLLPAIDKPGVLLIYTSDHGQALFDGGYDATNCSGANAVRGEGLVPLFVFASDPALRETFQAAATRSYNRAAHSDIFPTLLWAMGLDPSLMRPPYSRGLLDIPRDRHRRFFVFSPFASEMTWIGVD